MPGGDRTGPGGMGPMTGRAAGFCNGNDVPGYVNNMAGRGGGFGAGRGGGRGMAYRRGRGWGGNQGYGMNRGNPGPDYIPPAVSPSQLADTSALEAKVDALQTELKSVIKSLEALTNAQKDK